MYPHESPTGELVPVTPTAVVVHQQAESDQHLIDLWLHGRSRHTQRAYRRDAERFLAAVEKPLHRVTLGDLQQLAGQLVDSGLEPSSAYRSLSAIKSLFAFGHRLGYLQFDVARPLRLPALRGRLAERILDETDVLRMIALENMPRNKALLLTLYSRREYEATLENIADAAWKFKRQFDLPEGWESEVYSWLADNNASEIEDKDDTGGYPSEESLRSAFEALGFEKEPE